MFKVLSISNFREKTEKTIGVNWGGGLIPPPMVIAFSGKNFSATYDETLCKFLLYTYKNSHNLFWSKKLSS